MVDQSNKKPETMQLPSSIAHRGQLAGIKQPTLWYTSNPFLAIIQGTVIGLLENSVSILLIPLVALAICFVSGAIPLLIIPFISANMTSILIAIWVGFQVFTLICAMSLHLQLMIASFHQERISVHEAADRALERPLGFLGIVMICFSLPVIAIMLIVKSSRVWQIMMGGGLLLPSFYIIARLWLSAYYFYDRNEDLQTSLSTSWRLTRGHVLEMLGALAAQTPLCLLGVLSPLLISSGFTTRYFQLRYLKSHSMEGAVKTHWLNYLLAGVLAFVPLYLATMRSFRVVDDRAQICYLVVPNDYTQQICETKKECRTDPICNKHEKAREPTTIVAH